MSHSKYTMPHRYTLYSAGFVLLATWGTHADPGAVEERYRLHIKQRTISRATLEVGSAIRLGQGPLRCQAGVSLRARKIEVQLQGIEGTVYFRAEPPRNSKALKTTGR